MPHAWCSFYGFQCSSCLACKFLHKFVQCLQLREINVSMIWYCLIQLTHEIIPLHSQKLYWFLVVTAFPLFESLQIMIKNNFFIFCLIRKPMDLWDGEPTDRNRSVSDSARGSVLDGHSRLPVWKQVWRFYLIITFDLTTR